MSVAMNGLARFPKRDVAAPRLGGSPITSTTGYPWVDGDILYADDLNAAFLPLNGGGNVHGATTITVNTSDLPPPSIPGPPIVTFLTTLNTSGPTPGFNIAGQTSLIVNGGVNSTNKFHEAAISFWSTAIKYIPAGGLPAGTTQLQDQWAYIGNNIDATNQPSSIGGVLISEFDTTANHRDNGGGTGASGQRSGAVYVFDTSWPVGSPPAARPSYGPPPLTGGWPAAFNSGLSFAIGLNCVVNVGIAMGLQYSTALWDCRSALLHGGTIQTTVAAGGTTLHVNNVVGYMQWGGNTTQVSSSNPMPVTIGANTYSIIDAQFDAPGSGGVTTTLGTITLSSGIIGTDGAAGTKVVQQARTMWLGEGQQLALGSDGSSYIYGDGLGRIFLQAPLNTQVNHNFSVGGSVFVGGGINCFAAMTIGNYNMPASSTLGFIASGHATPDALFTGQSGSGANDGRLMLQASLGLLLQGTPLSFSPLPTNAANDAAAAAAGVAVGFVYRNGSVLQIRVA